jgi:hypothetical protein
MVNQHQGLLGKIHLQKYIYLLDLFTTGKIETTVMESVFLQLRREDVFWLTGQFCAKISKILDTFFLDVDEYTSNDLFDPTDKFNIDEAEFKKRAKETLMNLKAELGEG